MATGLVLALRITSDRERDPRLRMAAVAATPALALALYLTLSRGALAAAAVGIAALVALTRDRETARSALLVVAGGAAVSAIASRFHGVASLEGGTGSRELQGLVVLALVVGAGAALALIQRRMQPDRATAPARSRTAGVAAALVAVCVVGAAVLLAPSPNEPRASAKRSGDVVARDPSRLRSIKTNRLKYWDAALHGFGDEPLRGVGARGFATVWLERRDITESAVDAHSLYIETLSELGLVGVALLALFLGAAGAAAARVYRSGPGGRVLTTGWIAAGAALAVHAGVDWDWEMPAVALIFLALVAAALAASDEPAGAQAIGDPGGVERHLEGRGQRRDA
jgi:O-antigen ligase